MSTPPHKPDSEHSESEEHWDYAEDQAEETEAAVESGEALPESAEAPPESAEALHENAEVLPEDAEALPEDVESLPEDVELLDDEEEEDDETDEFEDDDDEDDDDLGEGIDVDESPKAKSRAPIIWALAAAAWVGVFAVKYGKQGNSVDDEGPSLAVVENDAAEPTPAPSDAAELDDEDRGTPSEPAPEEELDEGPSKIKLPEGLGGRWFNPNWAADLSTPKRVHYTVKRGGSIKNIANLYTIYHHEIQAWNPGLKLDQELKPGTKVVIYERPTPLRSESVGLATRGSLEGGVPMMDGPGRILKHKQAKAWATAHVVAMMDKALIAWSERGEDVQPVLVGNMAARNGGRLPPHGSHQSGRDVDISYIQKGPEAKDLNWRDMTEKNLDAGETWKLLETLVATGAVEHIFIDRKLQKVLYDHAVAEKLVSRRDLSTWLEYPRKTGSANAIVKHVKGHTDHIHVRFGCPAEMKRCRSK